VTKLISQAKYILSILWWDSWDPCTSSAICTDHWSSECSHVRFAPSSYLCKVRHTH